MITVALVIAFIACSSAAAHPVPHKRGMQLTGLLAFQERAVAHHRYVCLHGNMLRRPTRWHCRALEWSARELRETRLRWEWSWRLWLPDKWRRVGMCETHLDWRHANGSFLSAFGISVREYDANAAYRGVRGWYVKGGKPPTPWEQWQAALGHYERFGGFDGWGCRGA